MKSMDKKTYKVAIIGGGLAGATAALELAKEGYSILLIEKEDETIPKTSSSFNESYRLHTGMHYLGDPSTAKECLKSSLSFVKEFPDCILGGNDTNSILRRGRYYIMSNSLFSTEIAKNTAKELKKIYEEIVKDENNEVFGSPGNFFRILQPKDYEYIKKEIDFYDLQSHTKIHVALGIETSESQIDIEKLKKIISEKINSNKNITFISGKEVVQLSQKKASIGYTITTNTKDKKQELFESEGIVNCSWQNVEKLNQTIGNYIPDPNRVNRLKISILVTLPEDVKKINTCLFSAGPYCSFTNLGDGTGILTSEKTTNIGEHEVGKKIEVSKNGKLIRDAMEGKLKHNEGEGKNLSEKILKECSLYIPALSKCTIKELRLGYVKLMGINQHYKKDSIYSKNSPIHARDCDGIEINDLAYISGASMKMIYAQNNAVKIRDTLSKHFNFSAKISRILNKSEGILREKYSGKKLLLLKPLLYITFKEFLWSKQKKNDLNEGEDHLSKIVCHEIENYFNKNDAQQKKIRSFDISSLKFFKNKGSKEEKEEKNDKKNMIISKL